MISTLKTIFKGAAMGIAEVIPGVSGGTIAFITGIYERLLNAVRNVNLGLVSDYKTGGVKAVWSKIDGLFLTKLFVGMAVGFLLGLKVIVKLLDSHPILVWSFFFGLILASIPIIWRQVSKWSWKEIVLLIAGAVLVYWVTVANPIQGSDNLILVFLAGVIGVSALMLPGLSGSFVLLLLGMYTIVMPAIHRFTESPFGPETYIILAFGAGMIIGLFSFARVLSFTFKKYPNQTLATLTGFLIGSLNKVWPWQEATIVDASEEGFKALKASKSVLPNTFSQLTDNYLYGNDPQVLGAIISIGLAILLVFGLEKMSKFE